MLLAVSGGPDSMAMLQGLMQCYDRTRIVVGHFNHRLRGEASEADAALVESVARELGSTIEIGWSETLQPGQVSLEAEARRLRYQWLTATAERLKCSWIMTGHTLNDQAETVLHHLVRGTGWRGLRGIAQKKRLTESIQLGRPLLPCTKINVLDYLKTVQAQYCVDASNEEIHFTRNRLRHQVMPELQTINPSAVQHLAHWAKVARKQYREVKNLARVLLAQATVHVEADAASLRLHDLEGLDAETLQELLRQLWCSQGWTVDAMNRARWREVMEVFHGKRSAVELPGRVEVRRRLDVVQFQVDRR